MRKVKCSNFKIKNNGDDNDMKDILFVVTYNLLPKSLSAIIDKNYNLIDMHINKDMKGIFTPQDMASFRSVLILNT